MAYQGMTIIGGNGDVRGDLMGDYAERFKADAILTLKDPYFYNVHTVRSLPVPWIATVPVDTEPVSAAVAEIINYASVRLAIAPSGGTLLAQEGIQVHYTPLGVDTAFLCPGEQAAARDALKLPPGEFVAAFVGANQTRPSRKALEQILMAWAQFLHRNKSTHPGAVLYLHTRLGPEFGGYDLNAMIAAFGIPDRNWRAVDQIAYQGGYVPREQVRDVYRAADVLLSPSTGEGFGLTLVESQSCGVPVIAMDFSAMRDTLWSGWKITRDHAEPEWEPSGAFRLRVHVDALENAIQQAAQAQGSETETQLAALARSGAARYDLDHVVKSHWVPALEQIEALLIKGVMQDATIGHHERTVEPSRQIRRDAPRLEQQTHRVVGQG
jgi:glycosyltransferase involved in cell wall biosynthesis